MNEARDAGITSKAVHIPLSVVIRGTDPVTMHGDRKFALGKPRNTLVLLLSIAWFILSYEI